MKIWTEAYLDVISEDLEPILKRTKGVLVGFNVNIDKIIEITPEVINTVISKQKYQINLQEKRASKIVRSIEDFFYFLFQSLKEGRADEYLIVSNQISMWIERNFSVKDVKIGGQAGIIANLLKKINVNQILLSLPIFNKELMKLLDSSILVVSETGERLSLEEVKNIDEHESNPIIHYVFEFTEGRYSFGDKIVECKRSNRFIISFDLVNSILKIRDSFYNFSIDNIRNFSLAIVSGFHLVHPEVHSQKTIDMIIKPARDLFQKWKKLNPDITIHFEIAATNDKDLRKKIIDTILPFVDSIGLNEQELLDFIEIIDPTTYLLLKGNLSSVNLFKGIRKISSKFPHLRIHLHYLGYYLTLSPPISKELVSRRKKSLLLASLFAAETADKKVITSKEDILNVQILVSSKGMNELHKLEAYLNEEYNKISIFAEEGWFTTPSFTLVSIPTIMVNSPKQLVGLGDTISSISVLFDNI
ncbi:MAG: hypothetical protein KAR08_08920 [Candidatus Heimdallarchaeota archaeon]|nr:hypothetical protein [Candidatus Heimdallarchaeota archaeon]